MLAGAGAVTLAGIVIGCICATDASARVAADKHAAAEAVSFNYGYVTTPGSERLTAIASAKRADRVTFSAAARNVAGGRIVARVSAIRMRRAGGSNYRYESRRRSHAVAVDHRYVTATLKACNEDGCTRLIAEFVDNRLKRKRFVRD